MASFKGVFKVVKVGEMQTFASGFQKREVTVEETEGKYPQTLSLQFNKEQAELAKGLRAGDLIEASVSVRSHEWKERICTDLVCFSSKLQANCKQTAREKEKEIEKEKSSNELSIAPEPATPDSVAYDDVADDMPF